MSTIVDTLVTKYTLDSGQYRTSAGKVTASTNDAAKSLVSAKGMLGAFQESLSKLTMVGVGAAAAIAGVGFAGFGMMKQAAEFDTMASTFAGAFGSMDAGVNVMKALEDRAVRSAYSLEALTQASVKLATSGLSLSRFVPMMEKFALVVSGTDPQGLEQVASAFARIKGGSFGEAMEVFRRAGIGADTLRAQGIKVDKGGQIQSSVDDLFEALERISGPGSQLDQIASSVAQSTGVTISNAGDAVGRAVRNIGTELNERFLPLMANATTGLAEFTQNGGFELVLNDLLGSMNESADAFQEAFKWLAATVIGWTKYLEGVFTWGVTLEDAAKNAANAVVQFEQRYEENAANRALNPAPKAELPGTANVAPSSAAPPAGMNYMASQTRYLAEVSANTRRMVDLQEMIVGGGGLAAMGISANDLSMYRTSRNRPPSTDPMLQRLGIYVTTQTLATMGGVR